MRFSLIPRETRFFDHFDGAGALLTQAAEKFLALVQHFDRLEERTAELKQDELLCDEVIGRIITALGRDHIGAAEQDDGLF